MNSVTIDNIDWLLLHNQKQWLLRQAGDEADGLISLLDALEDAALAEGNAQLIAVLAALEGEPA